MPNMLVNGYARLMGSLLGNRCCVFVLHRVRSASGPTNGHDLEFISEVIDRLREAGCSFTSLGEMVAADSDRSNRSAPRVAFTIDDGYADQVVLADHLLALGVRPALFVITDLVSGRDWPWDAKLSWLVSSCKYPTLELNWAGISCQWALGDQVNRRSVTREIRSIARRTAGREMPQFLEAIEESAGVTLPVVVPSEFTPATWNDVRALASRGVDIGIHSVTHRVMSSLTDGEARAEIEESLAEITSTVPEALPIMAWPTGSLRDFSGRDMQLAAEAGVQAAFAVTGDYADFGAGQAARFSLGRFALPSTSGTSLRYAMGVEYLRQLVLPPQQRRT